MGLVGAPSFKVSCLVALLFVVVGGMTASVLVPPELLTENEEGEDRGETYGADGVRYRLMHLQDRLGRMPSDPYGRVKAQVDLLQWTGASRRIEFAPAPPINPEMFSSAASLDEASLANPNVSPSTWRWIGPGNIGGRIRSLAISPTNPDAMFAGSVGGGIWKTTNGGASWAPVDDFMAVLSVSSIAINPKTPSEMYVGTGEGYGNGDSIRGAGIFKSTNGGATWSQLPGTAASFWAVNRLAISPDGATVLAVGSSGTFRSTDGSTFVRVATGIPGQDVDFNPIDSTKAIAVGWGTIAYSWDGGRTWQKSTGLPSTGGRIESAYACSQPDTIYAAIDRNGGVLYRSTNGGVTFSPVYTDGNLMDSQGWYDTAIWVSPVDSNHLLVGGIWMRESRDGGLTWQDFTGNIYGDNHVIVSDPRYDGAVNRRVFFGNDGGLWRADDLRAVDSHSVHSLNNNLGVTQFYGAAGNVSTGTIIGGTQDHGSIMWSPSWGSTWRKTLGSDGGFVASDSSDAAYFYAESIYLGLVRSVDGGANWTSIASGLADSGRSANFIAPFILDPNNPNRLLAGGASLWRSDDVKAAKPTWKAIQGASSDYVSAIAVAPANSDIVWVGRSLGRVYKSTNATAPSPVFSPLTVPTNAIVTRITIHPADWNIAYVTTGSFGGTNVLKTIDGGATWFDATGSGTTGLPDAPVNDLDIDPANPEMIYAATEVGVFQSVDGGAHWELPQDGPANVCVDELFWMGSTLIAVTHGRGAFAVDTTRAGSRAVTLTPSIDFGSQNIGSTTSRTITLTNSGTVPVIVYALDRNGPHASSFVIRSTTCANATLAPTSRCTAEIQFKPSAEGAMSASLWAYTNAPHSPHEVALSGIAIPPSPTTLSAPWTSHDIGRVNAAGTASSSKAVFTVKGAGADIWDGADAFQFVSQPWSGDGVIVARVAAVQNVHAWTKAGIMIRETIAAGSPHAAIFVTPGKGIAFQSRAVSGGPSASVAAAGTAPRWVKLVRTGSTIAGSTSVDGVSWTKVGEAAIPMSANVSFGLAVTSHDASQSASATFDNVSVTAPASLPDGWQSAGVGNVGVKGAAVVAGSTTSSLRTFTVSGSGADIWGSADAFHYGFRTMTGNGDFVARVTAVGNTHRWAKAGVMIRSTTSANAPYAMMLVSAAAGTALQYRTTAGGLAASRAGSAEIRPPYWVKLSRVGDVFTGYQSSDGSKWTSVGSVTIPMASSVTVGLAVTSHDNTRLSKATFDQVKPEQ